MTASNLKAFDPVTMPLLEVKRYLALGGMAPVDAGVGVGIYVSALDFDEQVTDLQTALQAAEVGAKRPIQVLGAEAYSALIGMVDHCLERRLCMGMDEGFKYFEPEEEHDFVKELRSFVALSKDLAKGNKP